MATDSSRVALGALGTQPSGRSNGLDGRFRLGSSSCLRRSQRWPTREAGLLALLDRCRHKIPRVGETLHFAPSRLVLEGHLGAER